jgi:hypothetical protein
MISQCQLVPYNPQSPEAIYYAMNGYLNQYGELNVMLGAVIITAIVTTFFPKVGHFITWAYMTTLLTYFAHEMIMKHYL